MVGALSTRWRGEVTIGANVVNMEAEMHKRMILTFVVALMVLLGDMSATNRADAEYAEQSGISATEEDPKHPRAATTLLKGRVQLDDGDAHDATVLALAWPNEDSLANMQVGTAFSLLPLARTHVDETGRFALKANPREIPAGYLSHSGLLDISLVAWNSKFASERHATVGVVQRDDESIFLRPEDLDHAQNRSLIADKDVLGGLDSRVWTGQRSSASIPHLDIPDLDIALGHLINSDETSMTSGMPWVECDVTLLQRYNRNARIGDAWPEDSGQKASFVFDGTQMVSLQMAYKMSTDNIGYRRGDHVTRSAGFTQDWKRSSKGRYFRVNSNVGKYEKVCYIVTSGDRSYAYTRTEVKSIRLTGGTSARRHSWEPSWNHCRNIAAGTWRRHSSEGSAYSHGFGFNLKGIVGFDVTSTSQYDSSNELRYHQSTNRYKACGNDDEPAWASRVEGDRR